MTGEDPPRPAVTEAEALPSLRRSSRYPRAGPGWRHRLAPRAKNNGLNKGVTERCPRVAVVLTVPPKPRYRGGAVFPSASARGRRSAGGGGAADTRGFKRPGRPPGGAATAAGSAGGHRQLPASAAGSAPAPTVTRRPAGGAPVPGADGVRRGRGSPGAAGDPSGRRHRPVSLPRPFPGAAAGGTDPSERWKRAAEGAEAAAGTRRRPVEPGRGSGGRPGAARPSVGAGGPGDARGRAPARGGLIPAPGTDRRTEEPREGAGLPAPRTGDTPTRAPLETLRGLQRSSSVRLQVLLLDGSSSLRLQPMDGSGSFQLLFLVAPTHFHLQFSSPSQWGERRTVWCSAAGQAQPHHFLHPFFRGPVSEWLQLSLLLLPISSSLMAPACLILPQPITACACSTAPGFWPGRKSITVMACI
ncbi:uncharacterized protein LOC141743813 [Larus michahellis]|uniref:uncharacterized protein LOC141743813 n=1 Tax=Larus michahellis TaxID=119627 RepID=UPI003D9BC808